MNDEIQTGFVGWFDILGYEQFLEKNAKDLAHCVEVIQEVIAKAEREVMGEFKDSILARVPPEKHEEKAFLHEVQRLTKWVVFADTVVLALPVQAEDIWQARFRIATFLHLSKSLFIHFLGSGLPVRGAISFGTFYMSEHPALFAGEPLVKAHQWADNQAWTGCVLTPGAENIFNQIIAESDPENRKLLAGYVMRWITKPILPDFVTAEETMLCLKWPRKIGGFQTEAELLALIEKQFSRHGKDAQDETVKAKVKAKIENTIKFARHCRELPSEVL